MKSWHLFSAAAGVIALGALLAVSRFAAHGPQAGGRIDFNRDIRPILNQNCTSCHGGVKQAGEVSFIYRDEVLGKGKSGRPIVLPGRPHASELIARVTSTDPQTRMPLRAPPLPPAQVDLLKRWIEEGAQWEDYWAFVAPKSQALPEVKQTAWVRQPLDRFILARLEKEALAPSAQADKAALLRRVSFDLVGLPPSPKELQDFLADTAENAYEKQVDRLLASPHYGERWATLWLDLARYADSKGYDQDNIRAVWPYRDWVVDAFNRNLPYDRFVITQLAGDLLPAASFEDHIATSFHRQATANDEVGTDDEEFRLTAVMDRVATTWSVINGVTINCVQCHSHPYDPIRQQEYYKFLAFFNTSRDSDAQMDDGPVLHVPKDRAYYRHAFELQQQIAALSEAVVDGGGKIAADAAQWKLLPIEKAHTNKTVGLERQLEFFERQAPFVYSEVLAFAQLDEQGRRDRMSLYEAFVKQAEQQIARARSGAGDEISSYELRSGEAWATSGNVGAAAVSELLAGGDLPALTALRVEVPPVQPETASHSPDQGFVIQRIDAWVVHPDGHEEKVIFGSFAPDVNEHLTSQLALIGVREKNPAPPGPSALAAQVRSGGFEAVRLFHTRWMVAIPATPVVLVPGSRLKVQLTQINSLATNAAHAIKPTVARRIRLSGSSDPRWTALAADAERANQIDRIEALYQRLARIPTVPVPVMLEQPKHEQRQTLLFARGNFLDKSGSPLAPDVPALFPQLLPDKPRDRLAMARWFFTAEQPLTARVAVNRFWEQLFGTGIVETLEDFGSVGEKPSHPELLDWLALRFQNDLRWDMKALLRELVLSATYRQSAETTVALLKRDPRNRLLARGPRQRLTAEMVRDQALVASGLLTPTLGGPPVMPPLPPGIETRMGYSLEWIADKGPDRYRRALYIRLQRRNPYPSLLAFDGSARDVTYARRISTNTPLQALMTLNDAVADEAAAALARRIWTETPRGGSDEDVLQEQLAYGARLVLSRDPMPGEIKALRELYQRTLMRVAGDSSSPRPIGAPYERVALTAVASVLLNFDAALTR